MCEQNVKANFLWFSSITGHPASENVNCHDIEHVSIFVLLIAHQERETLSSTAHPSTRCVCCEPYWTSINCHMRSKRPQNWWITVTSAFTRIVFFLSKADGLHNNNGPRTPITKFFPFGWSALFYGVGEHLIAMIHLNMRTGAFNWDVFNVSMALMTLAPHYCNKEILVLD